MSMTLIPLIIIQRYHFPWLEVVYTCTLVKGIHGSGYWPEQTWGKFVNQDRSFHFRLRAWKEGWWKSWTPQIVLGANDPGSHENAGGGDLTLQDVGESTNHLTRFYLAATKHFAFSQWGTLSVHASLIQFDGINLDNDHGGAAGVSFRFHRPGEEFGQSPERVGTDGRILRWCGERGWKLLGVEGSHQSCGFAV